MLAGILAALAAAAAPAEAQVAQPAKPQTVSLDSDACPGRRGVFVRDLARATTRPASTGDGANRYLGPTKGSSTRGDAFVTLLCA